MTFIKNPSLKNRTRKAFTLIELLVVIAIIAILAAILFPVFAQAKESAKKATCLSNIKNVSLGQLMYSADYDDMLCLNGYVVPGGYNNWHSGRSPNTTTAPIFVDRGLLYPYLKSGPVQDCPSASDLSSNSGAPFALGVNPEIIPLLIPATGAVNMSDIDRSAETIFVADCATKSTSSVAITKATQMSSTTGSGTGAFHGRHSGRGNAGWVDGHAKTAPVTYNDRYNGGIYSNAAVLKSKNLGMLLKFPMQYATAVATDPTPSEQDKYYYLAKKPKGL